MSNEFELGDWNPWPLTPRTRYVLWRSLGLVSEHLGSAVACWEAEGALDFAEACEDAGQMVIGHFPPNTRSQPLNWWKLMVTAAERMTEAMRTGEKWNPRTPAEEAVLLVGVMESEDMVDVVLDIDSKAFTALPAEPGEDYDFREALASLCTDTDIEAVFDQSMDGIGDPDNEVNQAVGMGDYTLAMWHAPFHSFEHDLDQPSFLG